MIRGICPVKKLHDMILVSVEIIPVKVWLHDMKKCCGNFICINVLEDGISGSIAIRLTFAASRCGASGDSRLAQGGTSAERILAPRVSAF